MVELNRTEISILTDIANRAGLKKDGDILHIYVNQDDMAAAVTELTYVGIPAVDKNPQVSLGSDSKEVAAYWKVWGGWRGNHDQRIDDATCSKCGTKTTTVYGSLSKLPRYCPGCGSTMGIVEE